MNLKRLECCGIMELGGIRDDLLDINGTYTNAEGAMKAFIAGTFFHEEYAIQPTDMWPYLSKFRVAIFSQAMKDRPYGENFASYIRSQKLGTVQETDFGVNPNSGNEIKVWMWALDREAVIAWAKAHCVAPEKMSYEVWMMKTREKAAAQAALGIPMQAPQPPPVWPPPYPPVAGVGGGR